jgi:hypothetical protein
MKVLESSIWYASELNRTLLRPSTSKFCHVVTNSNEIGHVKVLTENEQKVLKTAKYEDAIFDSKL